MLEGRRIRFAQPFFKSDTVDELHDKILLPVPFEDLIAFDDIRMAQAKQQLGLLREQQPTLRDLFGRCGIRRSHLFERHDQAIRLSAGTVDDAHSAAANAAEDFVAALFSFDYRALRQLVQHILLLAAPMHHYSIGHIWRRMLECGTF